MKSARLFEQDARYPNRSKGPMNNLPSPFKSPEGEAEYMTACEAMMRYWPVPYESIDIPGYYGCAHLVVSGPPDAPALVPLRSGANCARSWGPRRHRWPRSAGCCAHRTWWSSRSLRRPLIFRNPAGRFHLIRRVRLDGTVSVFNEIGKVSRRLASQYVWVTIITHCRRLDIWYQRSCQHEWALRKTYAYDIAEPVARLKPEFAHPK